MAGSTESDGGARTVCISEEACYILMGDDLCEMNWFKQSFGSWFLGDYVCEDGGLYICTPVDPIFVLLPLFSSAHMSNGNDQGKFRQLDEVLYLDGYPGYQNLMSIAKDRMQLICEVKEIGTEKFYRLDDSKVLSWLYCKVEQLKKTFPELGRNYAAQEERDLLKDIIMMLGEYLKEPWLKLLCRQLKVDIEEVYENPSQSTVTSISGETTMASKIMEANGGNRSANSTKGRPPKKLKTQVESRNIKDMFRRVTRSGTK